jgi:uncharacterized protein
MNEKVRCVLYAIAFWLAWFYTTRLLMTFVVPFVPVYLQALVIGTTGCVVAILLYRILKRLDHNVDVPNQLNGKSLLHWTWGVLIGTGVFGLMITCMLTIGGMELHLHPRKFQPTFLIYFVGIIPLALMEELAFRGPAFSMLRQSFGFRTAQVISAVAFGLYHVSDPARFIEAFIGPFTWAFVFGLATVWSGGIAMATGIHVALNIWQALLGMKGDMGALWRLTLAADRGKEALARAEYTGLALQGLVLVGAWMVGEYYLRRRVVDRDSYYSSSSAQNVVQLQDQ